ncbi:MAG: hypothetical protein RMK57_17000 [Bryobacterales bacterium]|nr:hypothetical protein [Bryobacterales bacterium]
MRALTRLWRALESIPGLLDVPAFWEHYCGEDFALIQPYLLPTDVFGHQYPCPRYPRDSECPRRIVDYGDGEFAAICRHSHQFCERIPLTPKDALIHTIDVARFAGALAPALKIRPQKIREFCGLREIGVSIAPSTRNCPAFLAIVNSVGQLQRFLHELLLSHPTPFILLAPTSKFLTADHLRLLDRHKSQVVSLEETVGVDDDGHFVPLQTAGAEEAPPTPVADRQAAVDAHGATDAEIYRAARVHKSDFYKWLTGKLSDKSSKSKRIEEVLRTPAQPSGPE